MNDFAKYKIFIGAALAAAVSACSYLGYTDLAHNMTLLGSALLAALGLNAIGQGKQP